MVICGIKLYGGKKHIIVSCFMILKIFRKSRLLITLNHFQVNEKDTSNNLLNPKPEKDLIATNSCISLFEYNSIQPWEINIFNIFPSTPTLYQEYQTKRTGDDTSESINDISSLQESDKHQPSKLRDATKYQPTLYLQPQSKLCPNLKTKWRAALLSSNWKLHL